MNLSQYPYSNKRMRLKVHACVRQAWATFELPPPWGRIAYPFFEVSCRLSKIEVELCRQEPGNWLWGACGFRSSFLKASHPQTSQNSQQVVVFPLASFKNHEEKTVPSHQRTSQPHLCLPFPPQPPDLPPSPSPPSEVPTVGVREDCRQPPGLTPSLSF